MKYILFILLIVSCGKRTNSIPRYFTNNEPEAVMEPIVAESNFTHYKLPETLDVGDVRVMLSHKQIPHEFYETTQSLARYEWMPLPSSNKDQVVLIDPGLPPYLELVLFDQNNILPVKKLTIDAALRSRLMNRASFFELRLLPDSPLRNFKMIKDYTERTLYFTEQDLNDFFEEIQREVKDMNIIDLIRNHPDSEEKWLVKAESPLFYKMIHVSEEDLKVDFDQKYQYQKHSMKRINGNSNANQVTLNEVLLFKVSGSKVSQTRKENIEYIFNDPLPFTRMGTSCVYVRYHAVASGRTVLRNQEIYQVLQHHHEYRNANFIDWNYPIDRNLKLHLPNLTDGYFNIGVLERRCSGGPAVRAVRVNAELELELIVESYVRRP